MAAIRAINIAVVASEALEQLAKRSNSRVLEVFDKSFTFDALTPHITLLQLYVNKEDVTTLCSHVEQIVAQVGPPKITIKEAEAGSNFNSHKLPGIAYENNEAFQTLHNRLFEEISGFAVPPNELATINLRSSFCNTIGPVNQDSIDYVKNFFVKSSKDNYAPHMSVGCVPATDGNEAKTKIEKEVEASKETSFDSAAVVVAHLANYCTASSIFGKYKFGTPATQTK